MESTRTHVVLTAFRHRISPEIAFEIPRGMLNIYCFFCCCCCWFPEECISCRNLSNRKYFRLDLWNGIRPVPIQLYTSKRPNDIMLLCITINAMNNNNMIIAHTVCENFPNQWISIVGQEAKPFRCVYRLFLAGYLFKWSICRQLLSNFFLLKVRPLLLARKLEVILW